MEKSRELDRRLLVILRHSAPLYGLLVRHDGYIQVDSLLDLPILRAEGEAVRVDFDYLNAFAIRRAHQVELLERRSLSAVHQVTWYIRAKNGHTILNVNAELEEVSDPEVLVSATHVATSQTWERIRALNGIPRQKNSKYVHFRTDITVHDSTTTQAVFLVLDIPKAMKAGITFYRSHRDEILTTGNGRGVVPLRLLYRTGDAILQQDRVSQGAQTCLPPRNGSLPAFKRAQDWIKAYALQPGSQRLSWQVAELGRAEERLRAKFDHNERQLHDLSVSNAFGIRAPQFSYTPLSHSGYDQHTQAFDEVSSDLDSVIITSGTPKPPIQRFIVVPVGIPGCGKTGLSAALAHLFSCAHTQVGDFQARGFNPTKPFLASVSALLHDHRVVIADRNNHLIAHRRDIKSAASAYAHEAHATVTFIALRWKLNVPTMNAVHKRCANRILTWRQGQQWFVRRRADTLEDVLWKFMEEAEPLQPGEADACIDMDPHEDLEAAVLRVAPRLADLLARPVPSSEDITTAIQAARAYHPKGRTPRITVSPTGDPPIYFGVGLSKALATVLRHNARKVGLKMRADGYARMDDLLALSIFRGQTFDSIKQVVEKNDKQRFRLIQEADSYGEDTWWIRANQGHTMESVKIDLEELKDASRFPLPVHATTEAAWQNISKVGISRMDRQHIHLLPRKEENRMRKAAVILIFIDVPKAMEAGLQFFRSENDVILTPGDAKGLLSPVFFSYVEDRRSGVRLSGALSP